MGTLIFIRDVFTVIEAQFKRYLCRIKCLELEQKFLLICISRGVARIFQRGVGGGGSH